MRNILKLIFSAGIILLISFLTLSLNDFPNENKSVKNDYGFQDEIYSVFIDTDVKIIDEGPVKANITLADSENSKEKKAMINIRGASSLVFDKKQYKVEFIKDFDKDNNNKISPFGLNKESDWVLHGPYIDRSLLRNHLLYSVSREILDWAPTGFFCDVYINNEYKGLYLLTETVKISDSRINLKDFSLLNGDTPFLVSRSYPVNRPEEFESYGNLNFHTTNILQIEYPNINKITENNRKYIIDYINEFEEVLYSDNFSNPEKGYAKYIDVKSFVDYFVINEYSIVMDAGYFSTYTYKDLDDKMKMTVWDFNNSFDNFVNYYGTDSFIRTKNSWFGRLLQDSKFNNLVIDRYFELRGNILSDEKVFSQIDDTVDLINESAIRNYTVWKSPLIYNMLDSPNGNTRSEPKSFDEAIIILKESISSRTKYLDNNIFDLKKHIIN